MERPFHEPGAESRYQLLRPEAEDDEDESERSQILFPDSLSNDDDKTEASASLLYLFILTCGIAG